MTTIQTIEASLIYAPLDEYKKTYRLTKVGLQ
jgi:hypothetical protein